MRLKVDRNVDWADWLLVAFLAAGVLGGAWCNGLAFGYETGRAAAEQSAVEAVCR